MVEQKQIDEVVEKADIVKIIGDYIPVQKSARNFLAVCPFHDDSNPSMTISPEKKIFKCFSCGVSGNAIKFVQNYTNTTFLGALKIVADACGVNLNLTTLPSEKSKYSAEAERLFRINEIAANFFQVVLASEEIGTPPRTYLTRRGFSAQELLDWMVGYASRKVSLYETLLQQGIAITDLEKVGLITIKDGNIYDYFQDRIVFPIKNSVGKIVGFSGRTLTEGVEPKYLNTRETVLFKKSEIIYNLDQSKNQIYATKSLVILEGFMDVISLWRIGIKNVVAVMGTNLSDSQLTALKKLNVTIKLFFDGDGPGIKAALKSTQKLLKKNISTLIVDNCTDKDPDELIQIQESAVVRELVLKAIPPLQYFREKLLKIYNNLTNPTELRMYLSEIFNLINMQPDLISQEQTFEYLSKMTNLSIPAINKLAIEHNHLSSTPPGKSQSVLKPIPRISKSRRPVPTTQSFKGYEFGERDILHSLIISKRNLKLIEGNLDLIPNPDLYIVLQELINRYKMNTYHENNWSELKEILDYSSFDYQNPNWKINPADLKDSKTRSLNLQQAFNSLKIYKLEQKEREFSQKISQATDLTTKCYFLTKKEKIRREINEFWITWQKRSTK